MTAARALVQLLDHEDPGTRLRAIEIFYDRLCGKPVQSTEADIRTLDVGAAIRDLWLQTVQQPPGAVIDVQSAPTETPPPSSGAAEFHEGFADHETAENEPW